MTDFSMDIRAAHICVDYIGSIGLAKEFKATEDTKRIGILYNLPIDYVHNGVVKISRRIIEKGG